MTRRRLAVAIAAGAALLLLLLPGCRAAQTVDAHPALYAVSDADTTIWLFGTIHLLPADVRWRDAAIDRAIGEAGTLVTEIPDADLRDGGKTFAAMATATGLPAALSRVPPPRRDALSRALAEAGIGAEQADGLKTWALAITLASATARAVKADRGPAPETVLGDAFRAARKPQQALETLTGQLALFDGLSEDDQRALLLATLDDLADPARSYQATLTAWEKGDDARIAAALTPGFRGRASLADALLVGRNRRWSGWIAARMRQPGKVLVAVGAGHLAGPQSVVAMLRARGFRVRRVQ